MLALLVILSLLAVFYAYFGYPLILLWIRKERATAGREPPAKPKPSNFLIPLTIIVTVRNEKAVIGDKLFQTLSLLYGGRPVGEHLVDPSPAVQVIVASDASDDGTDDIVRGYEPSGVELVRLNERGGKEQAQKAAIAAAKGAVIVFTDAKIRLNEDALDCIRAYFVDPTVGAVSSIDKVESADGGGSGEGLYVRYEMWLRSLESDFRTLVGLSGSCFAVRAELCENFRTDVPSDFAMVIESQKRGLRGVHAPDVVGSYKAVKTEKEEFQRKARTVLRGITALFRYKEVLSPAKYGPFAWQMLSHKLCRWLVPWFLVLATLGSIYLSLGSDFFALIACGLLLFYIVAGLAMRFPFLQQIPVCRAALFFMVSNAAIAVAWLRYLTGSRSIAWDPSAKV